ncbi:MAG: tetraacyldisaccharide 4'-kinase [Bacteroidetes bacterium]|nr:tetraacyldisaccharide 4'-kinase [Bacteroidota bacterium]
MRFFLARIYACVMRLRNAAYDRGFFTTHQLDVPVISVGNITAGGTGKTPIVEYLLSFLLREGWRPAVVTRGYKRRSRGMVVVSDGAGNIVPVYESGDEAAQIARKYPAAVVIADANRVRGARYAVSEQAADIILLDDAFQHRAIGRDCDIVVIDGAEDLEAQRVIPAGRLREALEHLRRADIVLLSRCPDADTCGRVAVAVRRLSSAAVFPTRFDAHRLRVFALCTSAPAVEHPSHGEPWLVEEGDILPAGVLKGKRVCAFCGIGAPVSFRTMLEHLGADILAFRVFPDHHWYTQEEGVALRTQAAHLGADALVTTEKDAMRLPDIFGGKEEQRVEGKTVHLPVRPASVDAIRPPPIAITYLTLRFSFFGGEDAFLSEVRARISRRGL